MFKLKQYNIIIFFFVQNKNALTGLYILYTGQSIRWVKASIKRNLFLSGCGYKGI